MIVDKTQLRKDGHMTLESGMNSGRNPLLLTPQECAYASNVTFRGGFPTNRQKFMSVPLANGGASGGAPGGLATFQTANFQGAGIYSLDDGEEHIMAMGSGTLYQLDLQPPGITISGVWNDGKNSPLAPQVWMCQPDIYFVIQDGSAGPLILQGLPAGGTPPRRAGATEVPVGRQMAYGQGRLWLAQNRQVVAGDLLGGPTSVISFTEQTYIGEAAFFGVPLSAGTVVALIFTEVGDTATGQGELLIIARSAVYSVQASVPRQATQTQPGWQGTPKMQTVTLTNIGGTGQRNTLNVNQDVFFRSKDGLRAYAIARNEKYGWGTAPISMEMNRVMATDSLSLLDYASATLYKNRVLLTAQPSEYVPPSTGATGAASFGQIVALDFNVVSSVINKSNLGYEFSPFFSQRGSPAYDGAWAPPTGVRVLQLLSGTFNRIERCFAFCVNTSTDQTEIWEIVDDQAFDISISGTGASATESMIPVVCQIETRAFNFKLPDAIKELRRGDLYFTSLMASIKVTVEYRSDGYPFWVLWGTMNLEGHQSPCHMDPAICQSPGCPTEGYWFQKSLPFPNPDCDVNTGKLLRNGFFFQVRITWEGPATLLMLVLHATELVEFPNGRCSGSVC
jgi:hypothetical protein